MTPLTALERRRGRRRGGRGGGSGHDGDGRDDAYLDEYEIDDYDDEYDTDESDDRYDDEDDVDELAAIDPRIEARRREVEAERWSRWRRWLLVLAVSVTVVALVYGATQSRLLDVDHIEVATGPNTSADAVRQASGIVVGTPLMGLELDRAAQQIRALPWVRDASVERGWTGTISVALTERVPVLTLPAGDRWLLVDADGRVLGEAAAEPVDLPVVQGLVPAPVGQTLDASSRGAIRVAGALTPGLRTRVVAIGAGNPDAIELTLRPAGTVRFGSAEQVDEKVRSLQTIFARADLAGLCTVDVRVPSSPVLTRLIPCA